MRRSSVLQWRVQRSIVFLFDSLSLKFRKTVQYKQYAKFSAALRSLRNVSDAQRWCESSYKQTTSSIIMKSLKFHVVMLSRPSAPLAIATASRKCSRRNSGELQRPTSSLLSGCQKLDPKHHSHQQVAYMAEPPNTGAHPLCITPHTTVHVLTATHSPISHLPYLELPSQNPHIVPGLFRPSVDCCVVVSEDVPASCRHPNPILLPRRLSVRIVEVHTRAKKLTEVTEKTRT